MTTFHIPPHRTSITPQIALERWLVVLKNEWKRFNQDLEPALALIEAVDDPSKERVPEIMSQLTGGTTNSQADNKLRMSAIAPAIMAAVYWNRARKSININSGALWSYMTECAMWLGKSICQEDIDKAIQGAAKTTTTRLKKDAANGRAKNYEPVRQYAYKLIRERCPSQGWPSYREAARVTYPDIEAFCKEGGHPTPSQIWIAGNWLNKMPNAEDLYRTTPRGGRKRKL